MDPREAQDALGCVKALQLVLERVPLTDQQAQELYDADLKASADSEIAYDRALAALHYGPTIGVPNALLTVRRVRRRLEDLLSISHLDEGFEGDQ